MVENAPVDSSDPDVTEHSDSRDPDISKISVSTEQSIASGLKIPKKSIAMPSLPPFESVTPVSLPQLTLTIALRRRRLVFFFFIAIIVLVAITLVSWEGVQLEHFYLKTNISIEEQQKHHVNHYNTFSGIVTTVIGQGVNTLVGFITQLLVLWLMSNAVFSLHTNWYLAFIVMGLNAGLSILLRNSLDALSIQAQEMTPKSTILTSDLSFVSNVSGSSTENNTFSEYNPENPTVNTVLRNLILPRTTKPNNPGINELLTVQDDRIIYGMHQREWMKDFLPTALNASILQFDLMNNKSTAKPDDLKANASVIADLLAIGAYLGPQYSVFGVPTPFNLKSMATEYNYKYFDGTLRIPTARLAGLLPPHPQSNETEDRTWLLQNIYAFAHAATSWDDRVSPSSWILNVSHVKITDNVWVDAITMETKMVPVNISDVASLRGPTGLTVFPGNDSHPDVQIHAYAVCINHDDTETLISKLLPVDRPQESGIECRRTSNSSMYIVSSGRHLVADKLNLNYRGWNKNAKAQNLHVVYSTTFARLSWHLSDLTNDIEADCGANVSCSGLSAKLFNENQSQLLLVNSDSLPLDQLFPIALPQYMSMDHLAFFRLPRQQPVELVSIHRTPLQMSQSVQVSAGDSSAKWKDMNITDASIASDDVMYCLSGEVLLPHNIQEDTFNISFSYGLVCSAVLGLRAQNYANNHIYMETTLQSTYTAGAFFLFQNAWPETFVVSAHLTNP